jgi:hypothetical protein
MSGGGGMGPLWARRAVKDGASRTGATRKAIRQDRDEEKRECFMEAHLQRAVPRVVPIHCPYLVFFML